MDEQAETMVVLPEQAAMMAAVAVNKRGDWVRLRPGDSLPGFTPVGDGDPVEEAYREVLHPRDRRGRWRHVLREFSVGVTPFRPGDEASGFHASPKVQEFITAMSDAATKHGVTITDHRPVTGVWLGETEPAFAVDARDGEDGVLRWAEDLRAQYDQDGVYMFAPDPDGDFGSFTFDGIDKDEAIKAMREIGVDGGRVVGDKQLEVWAHESEGEKMVALAERLGVPVSGAERLSARRGSLTSCATITES